MQISKAQAFLATLDEKMSSSTKRVAGGIAAAGAAGLAYHLHQKGLLDKEHIEHAMGHIKNYFRGTTPASSYDAGGNFKSKLPDAKYFG